jgi:hypothetical protein
LYVRDAFPKTLLLTRPSRIARREVPTSASLRRPFLKPRYFGLSDDSLPTRPGRGRQGWRVDHLGSAWQRHPSTWRESFQSNRGGQKVCEPLPKTCHLLPSTAIWRCKTASTVSNDKQKSAIVPPADIADKAPESAANPSVNCEMRPRSHPPACLIYHLLQQKSRVRFLFNNRMSLGKAPPSERSLVLGNKAC